MKKPKKTSKLSIWLFAAVCILINIAVMPVRMIHSICSVIYYTAVDTVGAVKSAIAQCKKKEGKDE